MSKDISFNPKQISNAAKNALQRAQGYATFIFIIVVLLIYVFLVFRISTLTQAEPSEDAVAEKSGTVKRLKIDQGSIDKIQQLQDQNIAVQSLFDTARSNPFEE